MHGLGASSLLTSELGCAGLGGAGLAVILVIFWFFHFSLWLEFG